MCESVVMTVTTTMLCDYFKGRAREKWLASQTGVATLSSLFIIPLGGALGQVFGWQGPFLVYLVSLVWVVGVAVFCWEPEREEGSIDTAAAVDAEARFTKIPVLRMSGILLITLIGSVMFYATITQNANAFVALGVGNPAEIGRYATLASLGVPIGTALFWGLGRLHVGYLLCIEFLLIGIGFTYMSAASTPMEYVYAANVQQIGCGLMLPTLLIWATKGLAYGIRGRGNGMWQGAFGMGLFLSGMTLTFLGEQVGGLIPAFALLGKACFLAAVVAIAGKLLWRNQH
jgi:predicted MFS family arabinose efflux permease